jgi:hypothetical protein
LKALAVSIGLVLLACLVVLAFFIWDESKYRTCIEEGGAAAGRELSAQEVMEGIRTGVRSERCSRLVEF